MGGGDRAVGRAPERDDPPPPALVAGMVAGTLGVALVVALAVWGGWDRFIAFDALHFQSVARDLDASEVEAGQSAFRYGRVGLPVVTYVLGLGQVHMFQATQAMATGVAFGVVVGAAAAIAARVHGRVSSGLVVLVVPGLWVGFLHAWADTLLAALVLGSILATITGRTRLCVASIAGAALTKELGAVCAVPAVVAALRERDWRGAATRACGLVPALLWWTWIRLRAGEWPLLADEPSRVRAISAPFGDVVRAIGGGRGDVAAAVIALVVGVTGITLFVWHRWHPLAVSAGVWGLTAVSLGDNVLAYPGDTLRVLTPAMCVVVLAVHLAGALESDAPLGPVRSRRPAADAST